MSPMLVSERQATGGSRMESGAEGEVAAGEIPEIELIIRWREGWTVGDIFLRKSFNLVCKLVNLMASSSSLI